MKMCLWRIQVVCVFIPSVSHGPLNFDDSTKKKKKRKEKMDVSNHFFGDRLGIKKNNDKIIDTPKMLIYLFYISRRIFFSISELIHGSFNILKKHYV